MSSRVKVVRLLTTIVTGYSVAMFLFETSRRHSGVDRYWPPQFYSLLTIAVLLSLVALFVRRTGTRAIILCLLAGTLVVLGLPSGPDLSIQFVFATIFVYLTVTTVTGPLRFAVVLFYISIVLYFEQPVVAWGIALSPAPLPILLIFVVYCIFLSALVERIAAQMRQLNDQVAQIDRLDRTVGALSEANLDFQNYATKVERQSQDEERKRIAREIHDIVGYTLMNLQIMMEAAIVLSKGFSAELSELLAEARDQAHKGLLETRRAMRSLRALTQPRTRGLRRLLELTRTFENATKVDVEVNAGNCPETLGGELDDVLYRMVQESLTNAFRHGNASEVVLSLWATNGVLRVTINDNGSGAKEIVPGIGLTGMSERLAASGGNLKADSTVFGFRVYAEIPMVGELYGGNPGPPG